MTLCKEALFEQAGRTVALGTASDLSFYRLCNLNASLKTQIVTLTFLNLGNTLAFTECHYIPNLQDDQHHRP